MKRKLLNTEMSYPDYLNEYISAHSTDKVICITTLTELVIQQPDQTTDDTNYFITQLRDGLQKPKVAPYVRRCIFDKLAGLLKDQKKMPEEKFNLNYSCAQILVWGHFYIDENVDISGFPIRHGQHFNGLTDNQWRAINTIIAHRQIKSLDMSGNELFQFTHWQIIGVLFAKTHLTSLNLSGNRFHLLSINQCQAFAACLADLQIKHLDLKLNVLNSLSLDKWQALLNANMNKSQIVSINIDNNGIAPDSNGWTGLINFLKQFPLLKEISVRWNNIKDLPDEKWTAFCEFITNSQITTIHVEDLTQERFNELHSILKKKIYSDFFGSEKDNNLKNNILYSLWSQKGNAASDFLPKAPNGLLVECEEKIKGLNNTGVKLSIN